MPILLENSAEPIPGYRLLERLGAGGFGEVWKCEAPGGMHKAIKFVFGNLEDVSQVDDSIRAEQELRSIERIKKIRHPYILSIERYEIVDGQLMIVTELADCSLYDRFKECRTKGLVGIPREELLDYLEETAEALDVMTSKYDLFHLDIKPQNLFLVFNHIKIGDFGLVKDLEGMNASVTGGVTPVYAAPETFEGYVSRFSDQYSLAIVYQELLTGVRPFSGSNARQLMLQHLQAKPNVEPLPPADRAVVIRALAKKPPERFETCTAFVEALRNAEQFATQAEVPTEASPELDSTQPDKKWAGEGRPPATLPIKSSGDSTGDNGAFELNLQPQAPEYRPSGMYTLVRKSQPPVHMPTEDKENGILRPTVVIGLGQFGRASLYWLRQAMNQRYGPNGLPCIKTFAIDTDPVAPGTHLAPTASSEDVLLTRLNRPARYIRSRDTLPPVENWLDVNMLYRMPRTQTTNGIRALGRLALVEHYRSFKARLERELTAVIDPDALNEAEKVAGLAFRSTQPRVLIVGHLGGGTAGGMFIDTAYMTRVILRSLELNDDDVQGVLFLPDAGCMEAPDLPEANAVAALYELYHYQHASQPFSATYESKMMHVEETTPPFGRYYLYEVPPRIGAVQTKEPDRARQVIQQAAQAMARMMVTPLGRFANPDSAVKSRTPYRAVGLQTLNSPRKPLIRRTGKLLLQRILSNWLQPLAPETKQIVGNRIDGFFHYERLTPEGLYHQFEKASESALGRPAEQLLADLIAPFQQAVQAKLPDPKEVKRALRDIFHTLGATSAGESAATQSILSGETSRLHRFLKSVSEQAVRSGAARLVYSIYRHLDKAGLRQSAVEQAHDHAMGVLDRWVATYEAKARHAETEYAQAVEYLRNDLNEYERLRNQPKRKWPTMPTPGERLLAVFRARYRALLYERIAHVYVGFRGVCNDQGREVKHCRERLNELLASLRTKDYDKNESAAPEQRETLSTLVPMGCKDLLQAVYKFCDSIPPEDLEELDEKIAERMEKNFPRLAEVCLNPGDSLKQVSELILRELSTYLEDRLSLEDAAGLFMGSETDLKAALTQVYSEAKPLVNLVEGSHIEEQTFLITPNTEAGKRLGEVAAQQLDDLQVVPVTKNDEVVVCRVMDNIELKNLRVLSEAGREAYQTALTIEHFTPHARQDIERWHCPPGMEPPTLAAGNTLQS